MLTLKDYADFHGLKMDEVLAVEKAKKVTFPEACAIVQILRRTRSGQKRLVSIIKSSVAKDRPRIASRPNV